MDIMGRILEHWRIPAATLFSVALIIGAYVLARGVESPPMAQASAETVLLQAIAAKDSDHDGLPDWEEALYGTNPNNIDSFNLGMTDGEAVAKGLVVPKAIADVPVATSSPASLDLDGLPPPPAEGTLTAAFAQNFFNFYLAAKQANGGEDLSGSQMNDVASQTLSSLSTTVKIAPDFKSLHDLKIFSDPDAAGLVAFAESADEVMIKNTTNATTSEINYLKNALLNNDTAALPYISSIAKTYRDTAAGLAVLPVPTELANADLMLINAMMRLSEIINDFTLVNSDPLAAMLALSQYPQAVPALATAFLSIGNAYVTAGVSFPADAPGARFVNIVKNFAMSQQAAALKP